MKKNLASILAIVAVVAICAALTVSAYTTEKSVNIEHADNVYVGSADDAGGLSIGAAGDSNFTNLVASGDITAGDDLTVAGSINTSGRLGTYNLPVTASTTVTNGILTEAQLIAYSQLDYTLTQAANTLTLPATSTITTMIPNSGDCIDFRIRNLSTTAASSTTVTAGTGMTIYEHLNNDEVLGGLQTADLQLCRLSTTDVTVYLQEWAASD